MPQLNPAPWLSTMVLVWTVLLLLKSLLAFHNTPTPQFKMCHVTRPHHNVKYAMQHAHTAM